MSDDRRDGHSRTRDAERVRAYLVHLRGGAPFLSGRDSRLLLRWMDEGVEVERICMALDAAAEKRRKKRVKTPLSLANAKTLVGKVSAGPVVEGALGELISALRASSNAVERDVGERMTGDLAEAVDLVRQAIETLWEQADRDALRAEAEPELEALKDVLGEREWDRAVEGVARDRLRQRHPLLSAKRIWDTVHP